MNIVSIQNKQNISFSGYTKRTEGIKGQNKTGYCISESYLMRNMDSCDFATNYITRTFPKGTQIVAEGCSQNEAYTWGVLLHDANKDKKYKIIGCDIVPSVIKDAKLGILNIFGRIEYKDPEANCERFLLDNFMSVLSSKQKEIKANFMECFEKIPSKWKDFNMDDPRYKKKVKRIVQGNQSIELATKRLEYMKQRTIKNGIDFMPKDNVFDNIIEFKVADIFNIDKEFNPKSTGLVSFQNALYHVLKSRIKKANQRYENIDLNPAKILFKKINSVLTQDGLFVMGTLSHDHLFDRKSLLNNYVELEQNGQKIKVFRQSPIHKLLRESGFEPIFYEQEQSLKIYLPSVWKKIKHL